MATFKPLEEWQRLSRKSDRALAELIGVSHSKISRAKRGLTTLPMRDQLLLERHTGITPAEWTEFYASLARAASRAEGEAVKKNARRAPAAEEAA